MVRRIAVAATAPFGADVLEGLARRRDVAFLLTRPDSPRGRGRRLEPPAAKVVAGRLGIPVRQEERLAGDLELDADVVIVAAYGLLIPSALLQKALWLNVHPSLLPRWRGAAPVERAILAGDRETGVTIHRTTEELDAGPVAAQRSFPIGPEDDAGIVFDRAAELAVELLDTVIDEPAFAPQTADGATYAEKLTAADRELDWSASPEESLRRVRALSPHIGARGQVRGRQALVWSARLATAAGTENPVEGGLELLELQPDGRRRMMGAEFLRGVR